MITEMNNFCRVFELPFDYPKGFCFGGGIPVRFIMIDWFNPISPTELSSKKHISSEEYQREYRPRLIKFISQKDYLKPDTKYLLITDFGDAIIIRKNE